jgi:sulfoxide reductase heme-binding subunit YedZ
VTPLLAVGPSAWWYLTRAGGAVSLVLLTATVVLGVVDVSRWSSERWPRFVVDGLHRNVSLLALMTLAIHIAGAVIDTFAPVRITDAFIPFISSYRPLWLGMGTLAFDLLLALILTSLVRTRLGQKTWRAVHWAAYACWPLALIHGLGTGTDARSFWMLALTAACLTAVLIAAAWRTRDGWPNHLGRRKLAATLLVLGPPVLLVWVIGGPLASGWAGRAGTPASLLASARTAGARASSTALHLPLSAQVSGSIQQSSTAGGIAVDISTTMSGSTSGKLDVRIVGQPVGGGGVAMRAGSVSFSPSGAPAPYTGQVIGLEGSQIKARVAQGSGAPVDLDISVSIDQAGQTVSGTVHAQSAGAGSP